MTRRGEACCTHVPATLENPVDVCMLDAKFCAHCFVSSRLLLLFRLPFRLSKRESTRRLMLAATKVPSISVDQVSVWAQLYEEL